MRISEVKSGSDAHIGFWPRSNFDHANPILIFYGPWASRSNPTHGSIHHPLPADLLSADELTS
jgi:hypothetical protein